MGVGTACGCQLWQPSACAEEQATSTCNDAIPSARSFCIGYVKCFAWILDFLVACSLYTYKLFTAGIWKSPGEASSTVCSEAERARDQLSSVTKVGSLGFTVHSPVTAMSSQSIYWSNRTENVSESLGSAVVNRESVEKRKSGAAGCRLFGIQLFDHSSLDEASATPLVKIGEEQPVPSLEAESDRSNINQPDVPSLNGDLEKSSQRSPSESQSKQTRTCKKVFFFFLDGLISST